MYLVIAEKPSVSRAIAEVIGAQEREDGYLQGTDCMVSWCFGHLAEYVSPDAYDEKFNQWRYEDLPIIPKDWKVTVSEDKKDTCSLNHGEISKTGWKIRLQKERIFRKELIGLCIHLSLIIP